MKLSVIMPTYNESETLSAIIEKVQSVAINKEIIIVNDGSTDNTKDVLLNYEKIDNVIVLHHEKNMGKGMAIRTGSKHITGDIVIIQDADLETDPEDYIELVKPIVEKKSVVVYGSRLLKPKTNCNYKYYIGGRFITLITNILYNQRITDEPTCYKVFDSNLFKSIKLNCTGFEFCPEITAKVSKRGIKIIERPINYYPRTFEEGKKLRISDGIIALWTLIKYRFVN